MNHVKKFWQPKMLYLHSILFGLALLLFLVASYLTHNNQAWWPVATFATAFLCLQVGRASKGKVWVSFSYLMLFTYLGLLLTVLYFAFSQANPRITLLFGNENLLASNLVVLAAACFVVRHFNWLIYASLASLLGLIFLGARVAVICLVFVIVIQFFRTPGYRHKIACFMLALTGIMLYASAVRYESVNLLTFSDDFSQAVWRMDYSLESTLSHKVSSPVGNATATVIDFTPNAEAPYPGLLLLQSLGPSKVNTSYVASVYLRSDTPQIVRLSSNLSSVLCSVSANWSRCVTPAGTGNGTSYALFRLTTENRESFKLEVSAPQLEQGKKPTEPQLTQTSIWSRIAYRIALIQGAKSSLGLGIRYDLYKEVWRIFLYHPIAGLGLGNLSDTLEAIDFGTPSPIRHAHNLILQTLAENGLLGFLAWVLTFWGVLFFVPKQGWLRLWPLVAVVLLLNTFDFTYYVNLAYYSYWLAVGLVSSEVFNTPYRRDIK